MKYHYRDFGTNKPRFTRGKFLGWTGRTGPLNACYAIFQRKSDVLYIPEYCLTRETRALLPKPGVAS